MTNIDKLLYVCILFCLCLTGSVSAMLISEYNAEMQKPYYEQIFIQGGFESWNQSLITVMATGNPSRWDMYCLQDVLNEWNSKVVWPKLGYSTKDPDVVITFGTFTSESWAGCAWTQTDGNKTLTKGWINIRTSWPCSREHVIRHELGHILGLGYHSNHPDSTMYKYANGAPTWSTEDIQVIEQLYSGNRYPQPL